MRLAALAVFSRSPRPHSPTLRRPRRARYDAIPISEPKSMNPMFKPYCPRSNDVLVVQLTGRMHYGVARGLQRNGRLAAIITDFFVPRPLWPLARRQPTLAHYCIELPRAKLIGNPIDGLRYRWNLKRRGHLKTSTHVRASERLAAHAVRYSKYADFSTIYSFDMQALETFEAFYGQKKTLVLEQCVAPRKTQIALLNQFRPLYSHVEFEATLSHLEALRLREEREWHLSDKIVCPSPFVRDELVKAKVDPRKIEVIPYGFTPPEVERSAYSSSVGRPLRLLFAGTVDKRKGISDVLKALETIQSPVHLDVYGKISDPSLVCHNNPQVKFHGKVPFEILCRAYETADLFVLPSFLEGSATVTYEAMSFGLPLIVTRETGSIIRNGVEGFVVASSAPNEIVSCIERFIAEPNLIKTMGQAAFERSREYTAEKYGDRICRVV